MVNSDLLPSLGPVGQIRADGIGDFQFSALFQQKYGRRCELLAGGSQPKFDSGGVRDTEFVVGQAIAATEHCSALSSHQYGATEPCHANPRVHILSCLRSKV